MSLMLKMTVKNYLELSIVCNNWYVVISMPLINQIGIILFRPCRSGENHDQSFAISRNAGTGPQGKTEHGSIRSLAPEENAGIESHNRLVVFIVT